MKTPYPGNNISQSRIYNLQTSLHTMLSGLLLVTLLSSRINFYYSCYMCFQYYLNIKKYPSHLADHKMASLSVGRICKLSQGHLWATPKTMRLIDGYQIRISINHLLVFKLTNSDITLKTNVKMTLTCVVINCLNDHWLVAIW